MNTYLSSSLLCAPLMVSFGYLIKKTYYENMVKKELIKKDLMRKELLRYNKFEDPEYNPFKDKELTNTEYYHNLDRVSKTNGP